MSVLVVKVVLEGCQRRLDGWHPFETAILPAENLTKPLRHPSILEPITRVDLVLWFTPLVPPKHHSWLEPLMKRLLEGSPTVRKMFQSPPFRDNQSLCALRGVLYNYEFTTEYTNHAWWTRERKTIYHKIEVSDEHKVCCL